jgi:7-cyano-7-deazaguanine synthase in queuosine biosynthesis
MTRILLQAPGERRISPGAGASVFHLDEPGTPGLPIHHNLHHLLALHGAEAAEAQAALLTAIGVWAADKFLARAAAKDAWTREIVLEAPASPRFAATAEPVNRLLTFLTGDRWQVKFRRAEVNLGLKGRWPHPWKPDAVLLFSGGLDSLAGAVDFLADNRRLLLVSHYDYGQLARVQQALAAALSDHFGPGRCHHLSLRLQFGCSPELTLRSRSLLYLTLAMSAAAAFGPGMPVVVPENGWISLNPPLTPNRLGTYSTRTTHPLTLEMVAGLWRMAGLAHPLENPYQRVSKGELAAQNGEPGLLKRLAPLSVSCARPVASRWQGQAAAACGYCYPCLLRRAALHRVGWDEARHYRFDALTDPSLLRHRVMGSDLRALLLGLRTWRTRPADLLARVLLDGQQDSVATRLAAGRRLLAAGFQEVERLLADKGGGWLWAYAGL